jgi:phosphoribosylformylglycinamidine (FGAM) synthase PurS component
MMTHELEKVRARLQQPAEPPPTFIVEVATKLGLSDGPGLGVMSQLPSVGVAGAREVRVSALYAVTGRYSLSQMEHISRGLLCDPITQEYRLDHSTPSTAFLVGPHWRVEVWLKPQVTDPVGETVRKAVGDLGLPVPESVRTGTAYQIVGRIHQAQVDRIARKLLGNPLIHQVKVVQR